MKSKPARVLTVVRSSQGERGLDAAALTNREFLDKKLIEGSDAVDLALFDAANRGVENF